MHTFPPIPTHWTIPRLLRQAAAVLGSLGVLYAFARAGSLGIEGVHVVPHVQSSEMRYRQKTDFSLGARVEVFLRNASPETLVIPGERVTLWAHQRIKREWFDISGGWVLSKLGGSNTLQSELFHKTLRRLHVNTAHIADVVGYTDQIGPEELYTRYPLKYFNKLVPLTHCDWNGYGGRKRGSPTSDELRLQAYHALASRITSLYWFNLSLRSLVTFPDLIEPMTKVGREIRMLDDYYLEGDAVSHERLFRDGKPDWDLNVIAGPRGALLFALDLDYQPDPKERVFQFRPPRDAALRFHLPSYLASLVEVFRVDADGTRNVEYAAEDGSLIIRDRAGQVAIYVVALRPGEKGRIEARRQTLVAGERALGFDPGRNPMDLAALQEMARKKKP